MKLFLRLFTCTVLLFFVDGCKKEADIKPTVAIPDRNFEKALIDAKMDRDSTLNGQMSLEDALRIEKLYVNYKNIKDLTGIEAFANMFLLECSNNPIEILNVENNPKLMQLYCIKSNLKRLDVSKNLILETLECNNNAITELDLSKNVNLMDLLCTVNQLTKLDLSANIKLERIDCNNNALKTLDLRNNKKLKVINASDCQLESLNTSGITTIQGIACSTNKLTTLDVSSSTKIAHLYSFDNLPMNICVDDIQKATLKRTLPNETGFSDWVVDSSTTFVTCK